MPSVAIFVLLGILGSMFKLKHNFWLSGFFFLVPSYIEYLFFKSYGISLGFISISASFVLFLEYVSWKQKIPRKEIWKKSWEIVAGGIIFYYGYKLAGIYFPQLTN